MTEISPERRQQMREYDHATRKSAGGRYPIPLVDFWTMAAQKTHRSLHGFIRDVVTAAAVRVFQEDTARKPGSKGADFHPFGLERRL